MDDSDKSVQMSNLNKMFDALIESVVEGIDEAFRFKNIPLDDAEKRMVLDTIDRRFREIVKRS